MYQECQYEMSKGNKQLPSCVNQTMEANLLDRVEAKIQYEHVEHKIRNAVNALYHSWRFNYFPSLEVDQGQNAPANQILVNAYFHPDLRAVNVSVKTPNAHSKIDNIKVNEYEREIFVLHPVFHLYSRLNSKALELPYYRRK